MPFDGQPSDYEVKKPDVFSLEGLIAWLETQDPATEYDWMAESDCLVGRYLRANNSYEIIGPDKNGRRYKFEHLVIGAAGCKPMNYGAALDRARALQQGRA